MQFCIPTPNHHLLTTRAEGDKTRRQLEDELHQKRPEHLEIDFADVVALTISFTDEFLGRLLTELQVRPEPLPVMLSGLNEDTAEEVTAVLERRKLTAAARVGGELRLLGGDKYLRPIFAEAAAAPDSTPATLAQSLDITVQNANNRLKRLVEAGALERTRSNVAGGGREFLYGLPAAFRSPTAA